MIRLTKMNGEEFVLNCDLIETISEQGNTRINLINGKFHLVQETMDEVMDKAVAYHHTVFSDIFNNRF